MRPVSRRHLLIALMTAPAVLGLGAQPLLVHLDGDYVHVAAPHLQFLTGKTLDRLHDGASVAFLGQLTLSLDANVTVQTRSIARYALSYDIWEEKFSVTRIQQTRRTVSHLSLDAAQDWIVDNLTLKRERRSSGPPILASFVNCGPKTPTTGWELSEVRASA